MMALAYNAAIIKHTGWDTIEVQQQQILLALYVHGEMNLIDLERYTGVKKSANSRNVQRMKAAGVRSGPPGPGWLTTREDDLDARRKYVSLTARGRTMLEKVAHEVSLVTKP